jgi:hypothetical protein
MTCTDDHSSSKHCPEHGFDDSVPPPPGHFWHYVPRVSGQTYVAAVPVESFDKEGDPQTCACPATEQLAVPNMNLLREVRALIDARPEEFNQVWFEVKSKRGTTRCVAGWVDYLTLGTVTLSDMHAKEQLGLTDEEAEALFFDTADAAPGPDQRAAVETVFERIAARAGEKL